MMVATAYFDESESPTACAVVGVASTADRWERFDADWKRMLDKYKIGSLHMKEFAHSKGDFESWKGDEKQRREFILRAIEIISRRCMKAMGIVIGRQAFSNTLGNDQLISGFYSSEYVASSFMCLLLAQKWRDKCGFQLPVDYVFDRGNAKRKGFQQAYDILRIIPAERNKVGSLSFADDASLLPLQAADFIAYEACKVYTDFGKGQKRLRGSLKSIFDRVSCDIRVPTEEKLALMVQKMREVPD
jgi:hypothetical protein